MATEPDKEYPADVVRGTFFEHDVPVKDMFVHFRTDPGGYARPLRQWRVDKLVKDWDRQSVGVLLLSMRGNGQYAVLDGQHRIAAARAHHVRTMDALVYIDLTLTDEARLYRKFGDYLRQTAMDRFHAAIVERVPDYLAIKRAVEDQGLHIPNTLSNADGDVDAVDALIRVSKIYGLPVLKDTLALIHEAWQGEHRAYRGMILNGTAAFLIRYQDKPNYDRATLLKRMVRDGYQAIERRAWGIRDANLASNPNAAWGQSLLELHDQRKSEARELGDWPKRHYTEITKASLSANLKRINEAMTPEQKSARTKKGLANLGPLGLSAKGVKAGTTKRGYSIRRVVCQLCNAQIDEPCTSANFRNLPNYHLIRREQAKADWLASKS